VHAEHRDVGANQGVTDKRGQNGRVIAYVNLAWGCRSSTHDGGDTLKYVVFATVVLARGCGWVNRRGHGSDLSGTRRNDAPSQV
jgi:hypothetical protein